MKILLQITKSETRLSSSAKDLRALRDQFNRQHFVRLPSLLEPELLHYVQKRIRKGVFFEREKKFYAESVLDDKNISGMLNFLSNNEILFKFVRKITGCKRIRFFGGRIYGMVPGKKHHVDWHGDMAHNRLIAISINLSQKSYRGGNLQIKENKDEKNPKIHEAANPQSGDAVIFRVASHFVHRVTDVEGKNPRLAFAGWFCSKPVYPLFKNQGVREYTPKVKPASPKTVKNRTRAAKEVVLQKVGGNTVLFNPANGFHFRLDPVAERIWELVTQKKNLTAVIEGMHEEYDVPLPRLKKDVTFLVQKLQNTKFLN